MLHEHLKTPQQTKISATIISAMGVDKSKVYRPENNGLAVQSVNLTIPLVKDLW